MSHLNRSNRIIKSILLFKSPALGLAFICTRLQLKWIKLILRINLCSDCDWGKSNVHFQWLFVLLLMLLGVVLVCRKTRASDKSHYFAQIPQIATAIQPTNQPTSHPPIQCAAIMQPSKPLHWLLKSYSSYSKLTATDNWSICVYLMSISTVSTILCQKLLAMEDNWEIVRFYPNKSRKGHSLNSLEHNCK